MVLDHYPQLDRSMLLAGVILHDLGKIDELTYTTGFGYTVATGLFTKTGATDPNTCSVTYTESVAANVPPVISSATGGC